MSEVSFPLAFLAGVLSFLSPCVLPLVPSYVTFITGVSFEKLVSHEDARRVRRLTVINSLIFILGFSSVFIALGASASYVGQWLFQYQDWIRIAGGIMIIIFGFFTAGILKLDFLMRERKFHLHGRPAGYIGTFVIGMTFAAGWTPCIGPMLGTILLYASSQGSMIYGLQLLSVYSLGLGLPFFIAAYAINGFLSYTKVFYRFMKPIMLLSGLVLIAFGVLLLLNKVRELTQLFPDLGVKL